MGTCDNCGSDTLEAKTFIDGEMTRLCAECRPEDVGGRKTDAPDTDTPSDTADTENPMDAQSPWDTNSIRDDWHPNSIRLPAYLQRRFDAQFKRLDWELAEANVERAFGKDRYYKPLVIALGLRELKAMDAQDVTDAVDALEAKGVLD